jgi:transcriptional regulator with XRE-family HTH domain
MSDAVLTPEQVKAARQLLGWSQSDLGGQVGRSASSIGAFELGKPKSPQLDLGLLRAALEEAGVEFVEENGGGVRLRKQTV